MLNSYKITTWRALKDWQANQCFYIKVGYLQNGLVFLETDYQAKYLDNEKMDSFHNNTKAPKLEKETRFQVVLLGILKTAIMRKKMIRLINYFHHLHML
jgi:hypothetical protein